MTNPYVVALFTDRPNILMQVRVSKSSTEFVNQMVSALKEKQIDYITFCRNYQNCITLYHFMLHWLGKDDTIPAAWVS